MLESIYFAPVAIFSILAFIVGGFKVVDMAKDFIQDQKHKRLSALKMSQCEPCKDYHIWHPGDTIYFKIDEKETGVGVLLTFHPEKVIVKNQGNKKLLIEPYLVIENETAKIRKHMNKSKNFLQALSSENSKLFLPEHKNNEEEDDDFYSELST